MEIRKNYRDDEALRKSFDRLAQKTFGLSFEDWYQNGYWTDRYQPYSVVADGEVVANVSVNRMDFLWNGEKKQFLQLGTVMTEEGFRGRGYIRRLMEEIEEDCGKSVQGIYLFANNTVLDFYPKFGYHEAEEYRYTGEVSVSRERTMVRLPMKGKEQWKVLEEAIHTSVPYANPEMTGNIPLVMFYATKFMQENVYYEKDLDVYVIGEIEKDTLMIHGIYSKEQKSLREIIGAFGKRIRRVMFGFTPLETEGFVLSPWKEEDTTLFIKGEGFRDYEKSRVMFPTLSHA